MKPATTSNKPVPPREQKNTHRYLQNKKSSDSTPTLLKAKNAQEKENNLKACNLVALSKSINYDQFKVKDSRKLKTISDETPDYPETVDADPCQYRTVPSISENVPKNQLLSSRELFDFREQKFGQFNTETFGVVRESQNCNLTSSREFLEQKRLKNEVLDEIILNTRKSQPLDPSHSVACFNHSNKKAKYRLLSEISEGEDEIYYCSTCAVNLLQQGFKVQELKQVDSSDAEGRKIKEITKFELKIKSLEERLRKANSHSAAHEDLELLRDQMHEASCLYDGLISTLAGMKQAKMQKMSVLIDKKQAELALQADSTNSIVSRLTELRRQIKERKPKLLAMREGQFSLMAKDLEHQLLSYEQYAQGLKDDCSDISGFIQCHEISTDDILRDLHKSFADKKSTDLGSSLSESTQHMIQSHREVSFEKKTELNEDEAKKPFRNLFSEDANETLPCIRVKETAKGRKNMLSSVREYPTFGHYA